MAITTVHVKEVGMALPDVIYMRVRDQEIVKGSLLELASPDSGSLNAVVQRDPVTGGAGSSYCRIVGQINGTEKMFLNFFDTVPTAYLDRAAVDNPANWPTIGGRTVTAVYRKSKPFDQGFCWPGSQLNATTSEHELFVQLDGNLPQGGPYTLSVTGDTFPSTPFTFNDLSTRACGIHASMLGFRPDDSHKYADFHLWIPGRGTEGQIDLIADYTLDDFDLIDVFGNVVFSGTLSEIIDATTAESGITNLDYASTTTAPKVATAVSNANPCEITCAGHGFSNDQKKHLRGFAASNGQYLSLIDSITHTITVTGTDTFTIPVNTSAGAVWAAGEFSAGYDSLIFDTFNANRYATTVHRADFSSHTFTTPGYYRIRIPGLGVSDSFLIDESVHYADAKLHAQGYYNQLSGIALDADVGLWDRPVDYVDGSAGIEIYLSKLPAYFSNETGTASSGTIYDVVGSAAGRSPWITATRAPTGWGISIRDAGDWDYHADRHCILAYWLLEFSYRHLPSGSRNLSFGFPRASVIIDPVLYAGIDAMGDQVHMALGQLDVWRKHQQGDGRIFGGLQFDNGSTDGGGGSTAEPSYCTTQAIYLLEADPRSNLQYVIAAAKMAQVFEEAGHTSLAATWEASAVDAFDWAEAIYQDYVANGATGTVVDTFFNTDCGYATGMGFDATQFADAMANLFNATFEDIRLAAIGSLYSLTDDTVYGDWIEAEDRGLSHQSTYEAIAAWEFCQAPSAVNYVTPSSHVDYYNSRWSVAITSLRPWPEIVRAFYNGTQNQSSAFLQLMHDRVSADAGRNQRGISRTTGQGSRYPLNVLVRDREAMHLPSSVTPGIHVYANPNNQQSGGILVQNASTDSPLNWTVETPTGAQEATYGSKRVIYPIRWQTPINEMWFDNSFWIYMTEYTAQENILPRFAMASIQHAFDGNTQTEFNGGAPPGYVRFNLVNS